MEPRALLMVLSVVLALNLAFATYFVLRGAWPIAPFMGLDVALLAWAFHASRMAARRFEHVTLTPSALVVLRHIPKRQDARAEFNPYWVRIEYPDPDVHGSQLMLKSHGRAEKLGSFLAPAERYSFAQALGGALGKIRNFRDF